MRSRQNRAGSLTRHRFLGLVGAGATATVQDTQWALLMAGSALAAIPVIALILQRHCVKGISLSGLKG
jgi:ABC-type glycerol-3-phosphate transport system permease component